MNKMSNKTKSLLVHEYLERVSGEVLEQKNYRFALTGMIKGHEGIYVLYQNDRLYYVGLASNLMGRVKQHTKDRHSGQWDRFSVYLTSTKDHIKPLESLLLRIFQPFGNRVKGKMPGASDLKPALFNQVRSADVADLNQALGKKKAAPKATPIKKSATAKLNPKFPTCVIRASYKGNVYQAKLKANGSILYEGTEYKTPSGAAQAVVGRNANGWTFWNYKNGADWISISNLRN
jgi:hypothetical protein